MLGEIYGDPNLLENIPLPAGTIVNHTMLPNIPLRIISGPHEGVTDTVYRVIMPGGKVVRVKKGNLVL